MSVYFDDSGSSVGIERIIDTYLAIKKRTRYLIVNLKDESGVLTAIVTKDTASLSKDICDAWERHCEYQVVICDLSGNTLFET